MQVMRNIVENGRVIRGWLGIEAQPLNPRISEAMGLEGNGVVVVSIYQNGPAHVAGLKPGDIITHIDDLPVGNGRDSMNQIAEKKPNEEVRLDLIRNGRHFKLSVLLAEKPVISS
jgi:serine protease DegS